MTTEIKIEEKIVVSVQPPKLWKVIVLNDDQMGKICQCYPHLRSLEIEYSHSYSDLILLQDLQMINFRSGVNIGSDFPILPSIEELSIHICNDLNYCITYSTTLQQ